MATPTIPPVANAVAVTPIANGTATGADAKINAPAPNPITPPITKPAKVYGRTLFDCGLLIKLIKNFNQKILCFKLINQIN
jgi:hypothetical protein